MHCYHSRVIGLNHHHVVTTHFPIIAIPGVTSTERPSPVVSLPPRRGRPALPRPPVGLNPPKEYSVTVVVVNANLPEGVFELLCDFVQNHTLAGLVGLERGIIENNLHAQMVVRTRHTSPQNLHRQVKIHVGWDKPEAPLGGRIMCRALTYKGMHTWEGLVGYCMKDQVRWLCTQFT